MVKAVFFDIDGTLIPFGHNTFMPSTQNALIQLKKKGIKIIIASGRPWDMVDTLDDLCVPFDGYILLNGQLILDQGKIIKATTIPVERLKKAYDYLLENDIDTIFASRYDTCHILEREYMEGNFDIKYYDKSRMDHDPVYQIMTQIEVTDTLHHQGLMDCLVDYRGLRWNDYSEDIVHVNCSKSNGILEMLKYYQIDLSETMAFGDGANDIDMLEIAHIGVAMGNASDEVKKYANYICEKDVDDGIYKTLVKYHVIEDELNLCEKK